MGSRGLGGRFQCVSTSTKRRREVLLLPVVVPADFRCVLPATDKKTAARMDTYVTTAPKKSSTYSAWALSRRRASASFFLAKPSVDRSASSSARICSMVAAGAHTPPEKMFLPFFSESGCRQRKKTDSRFRMAWLTRIVLSDDDRTVE